MTTELGGRPTKFTAETKEKLLSAISKGAPYEIACNYARMCYMTFTIWRKKAEVEKIPEYVEFFEELKEAEGKTALKWLTKIDEAMDSGVWQAASWKLERRHNKYFSQNSAIIEMNERLEKLEKIKDEGKDEISCQKDD